MAVKVRLMRIGSRGRPFYRVVAVDERQKRTGGYLELLGTYNPLTQPKEILLKQDRIDSWVKNGAVLSDGFLRITGKAPQRPPRKPKKQAVKKVDEVVPAPAGEKKAAEQVSEETPVEAPMENSELVEVAKSAEAEAQTEAETKTEE